MNFDSSQPCYVRHMGLWSIEPLWFRSAVAMVKAGTYRFTQPEPVAVTDTRSYTIDQGVAVIDISGPLIKGGGSFGEVNSVDVRRQIRAAVQDESVGSILLRIDSPGGTVAGTEDLANDVRTANTQKPVLVQIDDLGASAAYWVASQATTISANSTAEVGSIGTVAVLEDTSGKAATEGIQVHVVSTGAFKGAFTEGAPVLPEHLQYLQERVDDLNAQFLESVRRGRGVQTKKVDSWADGRVWIAEKAKEMGLIDEVRSYDQTLVAARKAIPRKSSRSSTARAAIELAERTN